MALNFSNWAAFSVSDGCINVQVGSNRHLQSQDLWLLPWKKLNSYQGWLFKILCSLACPLWWWGVERTPIPGLELTMKWTYQCINYLEGLGLLQIDQHLAVRVLWHVYLLLVGLVLREMGSSCCGRPVKAGNTWHGAAWPGAWLVAGCLLPGVLSFRCSCRLLWRVSTGEGAGLESAMLRKQCSNWCFLTVQLEKQSGTAWQGMPGLCHRSKKGGWQAMSTWPIKSFLHCKPLEPW